MSLGITWDDKRTDPKKAGGDPTRLEHITRTGRLAFDNSYPNTGGTVGEPLTALMLQLAEVYFVSIPGTGGYIFQYDYTASTVKVYQADNNNVADVPAVQIANAVDLSSLTAVRFLVIGRVAAY